MAIDSEVSGQEFADRPSEFWKRTAPLEVAKFIEKSPARIAFHVGEQYEFVRALAKTKRAISPARWKRLLKKLEPGLWTSCCGGEAWDPRVLCNGGVAIANFHRGVSLDLDYGISVSGTQPERLRKDVQTSLRRAAALNDYNVILMHHGPKGVVYTQDLPADCTFHGQTFLFTSATHLKGLPVLGAGASLGEEDIALRLFEDTVCIYSTGRLGDVNDTILDTFAASRCDLDFTFRTTYLLNPVNAWAEFLRQVKRNLSQELAYCHVPAILRKDIRGLMLDAGPHSWAGELFDLLNEFPPLFGRKPLRPPLTGPRSFYPLNPRCSFFSFETAPTQRRLERRLAILGFDHSKLTLVPGSQCVQAICVPFRNLSEARELAIALRKSFGPVWLTVPHLGLDHRETAGKHSEGNGSWFGFTTTDGVLTAP